jgi:hypothetical protein
MAAAAMADLIVYHTQARVSSQLLPRMFYQPQKFVRKMPWNIYLVIKTTFS